MREIKFRGMTEKGEWKQGLLTFMFGQYAIVNPEDENSVYLIDKETAGQYIGLRDKNGVEIYEGDIDQAENGDKNVIVFLLKAGTYCVMPMDIYLNNDYQNEAFSQEFMYGFGCDLFFDNCTPEKYLNIIGNIYEHNHLLG